jgi:SAM-dependent methyltransferase
MSEVYELSECLACGHNELELALDLGEQPLANNFLSSPGQNKPYPLAVNRCQQCCHLQLTHVVDPEIIYKDYAYVSGTSQTYLDYMVWFAKWTREYVDKWFGHVLDIGCNDGSQLDAFKKIGFNTYGVDPAENLHATSTGKEHKVVCGFWDKKTVKQLEHQKFDIIVAQNAFAHNPDPVKYLRLLEPLMSKHSLFFIQTSQADMIRNGEFDTIYHEHVNFYNIQSMDALAKRGGLHLVDVIKTPIHGTSYVFVLSKHNKRPKHIKNLIAMEADLLKEQTYKDWSKNAKKVAIEFGSRIELFREKGYKIVGYGAAAKGMTLLNFADVKLDFIIDDNPLKQGTYSPGKDIAIVGSAALADLEPDEKVLFVPLAWNVFAEIKDKILKVRANKEDRFLRYFPEVVIEH